MTTKRDSNRRARTMKRARRIAWSFAFVSLVVACGSRTGLLEYAERIDASVEEIHDAGHERDVAHEPDVEVDALPLIDATANPDVYRNDCPDANATLVYLVSETNDLLAFNPTDGSYREIGKIACPAPAGDSPFSMAVDRKGVAYVEFSPSSEIFRVSTLTAACIATPFVPGQLGFTGFGMGFSSNDNGPDETLFIAGDGVMNSPDALGSIDTTTYSVSNLGGFVPAISEAELTGTGDGRLFAFYANPSGGSAVGQLDKSTAHIIAETPLPDLDQGDAWAFGFWGGDFYLFTAPDDTSSIVTRLRPSDGTVVQVATLPTRIVGAGVSTCAPEM